jgi:hypothetical protein
MLFYISPEMRFRIALSSTTTIRCPQRYRRLGIYCIRIIIIFVYEKASVFLEGAKQFGV